ncbi:hypothetical protein FALBO_11883 [Fusarium albosuccineum]|uniref:Ubiquitin-like domain-containing protein n=1 Tax=Fusarium albosuccineum TaxID=1237068 RepID=A0A8H4P3P0_9HYPO|nr:hypothetical protein FALBO_11883 [Fusarium albosuccineum]
MDPLSIIASIAGIATAGTELSKAIYKFISLTRGSSKEMGEIARTINDLSIILRELRQVLKNGVELCSRRLLRRIKSAMKRISRIHDDIRQLINGMQTFTTFKWTLKRSEVQQKLARIESHKTGIQLMLHILLIAITTRKQPKSLDLETHIVGQQEQRQEREQDVALYREQAENLAHTACQSLVNFSDGPDDFSPDHNNTTESQLQVQVFREGSDDTVNWLFDLVFSAYAQSFADPVTQDSTRSDEAASDLDEDTEEPAFENKEHITNNSVVTRAPAEMIRTIFNPGAASSLVNELLAEWTLLAEKEIESTPDDQLGRKQKEANAPENSQKPGACIYFKDALGRKFNFPFHRVKTYKGMEHLIRAAFRNVDIIEPHVIEGHFDLIYGGRIILPDVWEDLVEPEMAILMALWPMDAGPSKQPQQPTRPTDPGKASLPSSQECPPAPNHAHNPAPFVPPPHLKPFHNKPLSPTPRIVPKVEEAPNAKRGRGESTQSPTAASRRSPEKDQAAKQGLKGVWAGR